ncbi:MAG: hypothetical protein ACKVOS_03680 [Sphingorhabdus sp.]
MDRVICTHSAYLQRC